MSKIILRQSCWFILARKLAAL